MEIFEKIDGAYKKFFSWVNSLDEWKMYIALIMIWAIHHGIYFTLTYFYPNMVHGPDLHLYRARADTILSGGVLYRDVCTRTPPLINYLFIPVMLFGGSNRVFQVYFSLFNLFTALAIFLFFKNVNRNKGFIMSFLYLVSFLPTWTAGYHLSDEAILSFFLVLPLLIVMKFGKELGGVFIAIGIWIKMWTILILPFFLIKLKNFKEMIKQASLILGISMLICLPFAILAKGEFSFFLKDYFLGRDHQAGGGVLWNYLPFLGIDLPGVFYLSMIGLATIFIIYHSYKKNWSLWKSFTIYFLIFFALYPKIRFVYFTMLIPFLAYYASEDARSMVKFFIFYIPMGISSEIFWLCPTLHEMPGIIIPIALCILNIFFLLEFAKDIWNREDEFHF